MVKVVLSTEELFQLKQNEKEEQTGRMDKDG